MSIHVDPIWLISYLLVFVRAVAWLAVCPPFSNRAVVPVPALIAVAGGLAILAVPHVAPGNVPTDTPGLVGAIVVQVLSGVVLGLPVLILFNAVSAAGGLVDLFGGLNLPPSLDPVSQQQTPLLGQLYEQVGLVLLFVTNGELLIVRGFTASLGAHGVTLGASSFMANLFTSDVATFFTAALEMAAPLIAVLFAAQIALAVVARSAPQLNVWILGFPLQVLLSLIFVAIGIRVLPNYLDNIVSRILQDMGALARGG